MEQEKLEERVKETFREQGFEIKEEGKRLKASKNGEEKILEAYSSKEYSEKEVLEKDHGGIVFVDEGLSDLKENMDISIIYEEREKDYELPSYEIIGDIAVISELTVEREKAIEGILEHHPNIETILLKQGGLKGEFRVGDYQKLYGEKTETVHREFGTELKVDPTEAYFSERFSTERNRIVSKIEEGEKVLVMFAGVGPFAVMAAKNAEPEKIISVEKNPEACEYLKENIKRNKIEDKVKAYCGDVKNIEYSEKFDRIVMPLPGSADKFLGLAMELAEDKGVINYYRFLENENWKKIRDEIREEAERKGLEFKIVEKTVTGDRGPSVKRVCLDIRVSK
ncbi:hypothetical protein AQV86_05650 [Nanohaloarchaea archaeon SG9]|nr:hypothetical protein AQV86_05650 [Nanohaloarchaea archaeon SG9]